MTSSSNINVLIAILTAMAMAEFSTAYRVTITNSFSHNNVLHLHCKSWDDDLGPQKLWVGQVYDFEFGMNLFGTTLFWCDFKWGNNHGGSYTVFQRVLADYDCGGDLCAWSAWDDGIYLQDQHSGNFKAFYDWRS